MILHLLVLGFSYTPGNPIGALDKQCDKINTYPFQSSSAPRPTGSFRVDYGFVATLDDEIRRDPERDDTNKIYVRLDDAQDDKSLMSGRLNMLFRDRRAHARTALLMEREARLSPDGDYSLASSRPRSTGTTCGDTETDEYTVDTCDSTTGTPRTC
ncbi:hypothetical protein Tco_0471169 [Tanacetum coccineum]